MKLLLVVFAVLLASPASWVWAQPREGHIGYAYPAGGRAGATTRVSVGGQFLEGVRDARITGAGVTAKVVEHIRPINGAAALLLRDRLKQLLDRREAVMRARSGGPTTKATWSSEDDQLISDIRAKLMNFSQRPSSPAIAEIVTLDVTIARDAQPGKRELRLLTAAGFTNPMMFCVGHLPEFSEEPARISREATAAVPNKERSITIPAVVNGQILPGGVNRYRFTARGGQHLVIAASARELIPYLADAVPGWFQATLKLYDGKRNEVAYDDDFRFNPDPALYFVVPRDDEYTLEIKDAIYRGREDFVYRITIGEVPFITDIFPLGGRVAERTQVEVKGWNLPTTRMAVDAAREPQIQQIEVHKGTWLSNALPFMADDLPACSAGEAKARPATMPVVIDGRLQAPNDAQVFDFQGKAGEQIVAEVYARRLNSPLDSLLTLSDAQGKQIAINDDADDKAAGLTTHQADSRVATTLPSDGTYHLRLSDAQHRGGNEYAYRLRVSQLQPNFELRVVPSAINIRNNGSAVVTVYALRRDGFAGEITLALEDAPGSFKMSGGRIPAGQDQVRLTISGRRGSAEDEVVKPKIVGKARVNGVDVQRTAVPAEDMMQAFAYRHLVPAQELLMTVSGRYQGRGGAEILSSTPVRIPLGGSARIQIAAPAGRLVNKFQLQLSEPPPGITIRDVSTSSGITDVVLTCNLSQAKAGLKGNLVLDVFAERPGATTQKTRSAAARQPVAQLPAIPFEVVAR